MSLFGKLGGLGGALGGVLGQLEGGNAPSTLDNALQQSGLGGLQGISEKLRQNGLGNKVDSWLGNSQNMPISAEEIRGALGNEEVQKIAGHFGIPVDGVLKMMEQFLPNAVDQASPDGKIDPAAVSGDTPQS